MSFLEIMRGILQQEGLAPVQMGLSPNAALPETIHLTSATGQSDVVLEPAASNVQPVYWESMDGTWHGPAVPESLAREGKREMATFWMVVTYRGGIRWIRSDRLRSRQTFEKQERMG